MFDSDSNFFLTDWCLCQFIVTSSDIKLNTLSHFSISSFTSITQQTDSDSTKNILRNTSVFIMSNLSQEELQQLINNVIITAVTAALTKFNQQAESLKSSGSSEPEESSELNDNAEYKNNNLFWLKNIEMFNLNSDVETVKVKDNKQIYYNIFSFINQLWVKTMIMSAVKIRKNIKLCLLDKTNQWYTEKLIHVTQIDLQNNNNEVKKWCKALKTYFCNSLSKSLTALKTLQYTV